MRTNDDENELDLRGLSAVEQQGMVLETLDEQPPGSAFVVVAEREPRDLLETIQRDRTWQFEWNVLEESSGIFRAEVVRRESPGPRTVSDFLGADNRRLRRLLESAEREADRASPGARDHFAQFAHGLRRHMAMEEEFVLPKLRAAGSGGPFSNTLREHDELDYLLEAASSALRAGARGFVDTARRLGAFLMEHTYREAQGLYVLADRLLPARRERLVRRMQACPSPKTPSRDSEERE